MKKVCIFENIGANTLEVCEGEDRLHRGFPIAEFNNRKLAELAVDAWKKDDSFTTYYVNWDSLEIERVGFGGGPQPSGNCSAFSTLREAESAIWRKEIG